MITLNKQKSLFILFKQPYSSYKDHAAVWVLHTAHIKNPSLGITNNVSESVNAVLHRLKQWKQVPLDVITVSLHMLLCYYHREIVRSIHQCGTWRLKDEYDFIKREPSMMPLVCQPREIVENVCRTTPVKTTSSDTTSSHISSGIKTHVGLANEVIQCNRVKAIGDGAWVVIESDWMTPRTVRLFPKKKLLLCCY